MALIKNMSGTPLMIGDVIIKPGTSEPVKQSALERFGATKAGAHYLKHSLQIVSKGDVVDAEFEEVDESKEEGKTAFDVAGGNDQKDKESEEESENDDESGDKIDPEKERLALLETAKGLGLKPNANTGIVKLEKLIEASMSASTTAK